MQKGGIVLLTGLAGLAVLAYAFFGNRTAETRELTVLPCEGEARESRFMCGSLVVPEDPSDPDSAEISLYVVRVAARNEPAAEPVFILRGGPGIPSASRIGNDLERWNDLNRSRDVVFIDLRGTGRSTPLDCQPAGDGTPDFFSGSLSQSDVSGCLEQLGRSRNPANFTTAAAADDIDAVRAALGYRKISLFGASYGSYLAQVYALRHPDSTARLVLQAPVPVARDGWAMAPEPQYLQAARTDAAVMAAFRDCEADAACGSAFSNLEEKLTTILGELAEAPISVELATTDGGSPKTVHLSDQHVRNLILALLYDSNDTTQLPIFVELLANHRYRPIASVFERISENVRQSVHWGLYLAVFCPEVYQRLDEARAIAMKKPHFGPVGELPWGIEACKSWPSPKSVAEHALHEVRHTPTLILIGELDPVIPFENVDLVRRLFPAGPTVTFANTAHSPAGPVWRECSVPLITAFLADEWESGADTACAEEISRPPFALPS